MAKGVPLTIEQAATVKRVWLATANASEAAREAGCSEASARRYIIRGGLTKADELYAQALANEERLHLATVRKARGKVRTALDAASKGDEIAELTRAANDSLRAVSATRHAHLKATGLSAPDRTDVTSGGKPVAAVVLLPQRDDASDDEARCDLAPEPGAAITVPRQ